MSTVIEAVGDSLPKVAPHGILRLVPSKKQTKKIGNDSASTGEHRAETFMTSRSAKIGLAFSAATLSLGLLILYVLVRGKRLGPKRTRHSVQNRRGCWSFFNCFSSGATLGGDATVESGLGSIYLQEFRPETSTKRVHFRLHKHLDDTEYDSDNDSDSESYYDSETEIRSLHKTALVV